MRDLTLEEVRSRIRVGEYAGPTSGLAPGHVQTNLVILPEEYAFDFLKFCVRNPKPCPVLEVTDTGSPTPAVMAPEADLRTDVPKYRVYEGGELVDEPTDLHAYWESDLVSFLIGCSFTFEAALLEAGLSIAHQDQGRNVPMYVTGHECTPAPPPVPSPARWSSACVPTGRRRFQRRSPLWAGIRRCTVTRTLWA